MTDTPNIPTDTLRAYTIAELAVLLGVTTRTVRRRVKTGQVERIDTPDGARYRAPHIIHLEAPKVSDTPMSDMSDAACPTPSDADAIDAQETEDVSDTPCRTPMSDIPMGVCRTPVEGVGAVPVSLHLELVAQLGALREELGRERLLREQAESDLERAWEAVGDLTTDAVELERRLALHEDHGADA